MALLPVSPRNFLKTTLLLCSLHLPLRKRKGQSNLAFFLWEQKKIQTQEASRALILTTPSEFVSVLSFISMLLQAKGNDGNTTFKYLYKYKD